MKTRLLIVSLFFLIGMVFNAPPSLADGGLNLSASGIYNPVTGNINYTAHWSVASSSSFSSLNITASLPSGTSFASVGDNGQNTASGFNWSLGAPAAGSSGDVHFSVSVDAAKALNPWTSSVVDSLPGTASSIPANFQNPQNALGAANATSFALGFASSSLPQLTLSFDLPAINATGSDITIFSTSPAASALVYASNDLTNWVPLGSVTGTASLDLGSLPSAKYIRITANPASVTSGNGYEIDAVQMLNLFPLSCNLTSHVIATGSGTSAATAQTDARVDIVPTCNAGQGSGGSGISGISGISGGFGGFGTRTPTTTPVAGPSGLSSSSTPSGPSGSGSAPFITSPPTSGGGGGPAIGGGISTTTPEGMGGGNEIPPQVLGAITLPRTGFDLRPIFVLIVFELLIIIIEFRNRFVGKQN